MSISGVGIFQVEGTAGTKALGAGSVIGKIAKRLVNAKTSERTEKWWVRSENVLGGGTDHEEP